jgi:hypothetical protein
MLNLLKELITIFSMIGGNVLLICLYVYAYDAVILVNIRVFKGMNLGSGSGAKSSHAVDMYVCMYVSIAGPSGNTITR